MKLTACRVSPPRCSGTDIEDDLSLEAIDRSAGGREQRRAEVEEVVGTGELLSSLQDDAHDRAIERLSQFNFVSALCHPRTLFSTLKIVSQPALDIDSRYRTPSVISRMSCARQAPSKKEADLVDIGVRVAVLDLAGDTTHARKRADSLLIAVARGKPARRLGAELNADAEELR